MIGNLYTGTVRERERERERFSVDLVKRHVSITQRIAAQQQRSAVLFSPARRVAAALGGCWCCCSCWWWASPRTANSSSSSRANNLNSWFHLKSFFLFREEENELYIFSSKKSQRNLKWIKQSISILEEESTSSLIYVHVLRVLWCEHYFAIDFPFRMWPRPAI